MEDRPSILREMRICRFCLTEKEPLLNIYVKDKNNSTPLSLQIMSCVALEVFANDGMPQLICDSCRTQTRQSYHFKTLCKRSDDALKLYLATGTLKRGDEEVVMSKSNKRSSENLETEVSEKRQKTSSTEEVKKTSETKATNTEKQEKLPDVVEIIPCHREVEEKPQEPKNKMDVIQTVEVVHEQVVETEVEESLVEQPVTKEKVNIVLHARITEDGEIIQQETESDGAYAEMQLLEDPTVEQVVFEEVQEGEEIVSVPTKVSQVSTQCFPCTQCERSFPLQQLLDIHMRQHTRERKFSCAQCGKRFFSKHDLAKHAQVHSGAKPFTCVVCEKAFSRATLLHRHEKIHSTVPRYLCTYCDKTYLASEDLDAHMKTHKKHRPFQCGSCDKRFAFKQGLERHEAVHSGENAHKCNYCEETFSTPSKLQRHIQCHAGARPYPCKLCPRTFLLSHHLSRHLRNHYSQKQKKTTGEFKCDVCSMSFESKYSLVNHSTIHSMVNLKCVICNKEFEDAQTVKKHITKHLSGLLYRCYMCDYSFENEVELMEHESKHFAENDSGSDVQDEQEEVKPTPEADTPRRSQREKKVKKYADFLKDEDFSEIDEPMQDSDEEFIAIPQKNIPIQPVVRSETMKVYKGIKDKKTPQKIELPQKPKEPKTLTKITTLEHLGLSKSTLDAMTEKSGFVEMKIGQKVIRVQKLMMTKADVQAMAEQGKIEMKGSKVVVKNTGGILDLNKLTNANKAPLTVVDEGRNTTIQDGAVPEELVRDSPKASLKTYVKRQLKKDDSSEALEPQEAAEPQEVAAKPEDTANIDLSENTHINASIHDINIE